MQIGEENTNYYLYCFQKTLTNFGLDHKTSSEPILSKIGYRV